MTDIAGESTKLYQTLQQSVDDQIQTTGFVPPDGYGMENGSRSNGNGNGNGHSSNGNGGPGISEKQLDLINKIVKDNNLNKADVENMAVEMFGGGVRTLNKMQASNLIDELFERHPRKTNGRGNYQPARSR